MGRRFRRNMKARCEVLRPQINSALQRQAERLAGIIKRKEISTEPGEDMGEGLDVVESVEEPGAVDPASSSTPAGKKQPGRVTKRHAKRHSKRIKTWKRRNGRIY